MSDFIASLDLEIDRLEKATADIPEVRKLRELQRVRALYVSEGLEPPPGYEIVRSFQTAIYAAPRAATTGRKMSGTRQRALEFATVFLGGQTTPIRTTTILEALAGNGIPIGGNDPVNSLSALLSTSGKFVAHGRSGWTLKPPEGQQVSAPAQAENGNPGAGAPGPINEAT